MRNQYFWKGFQRKDKKAHEFLFFFENGSRFHFSMPIQRYLLQISSNVINPELDFQDGGCIDSFLWFFFREILFFLQFDRFLKILRKILPRKCSSFKHVVENYIDRLFKASTKRAIAYWKSFLAFKLDKLINYYCSSAMVSNSGVNEVFSN